jgi:hypothetical protein
MEAPKGNEQVKGRALQCLLCKGVMILNAVALQSHLGSKKHQRRAAKLPTGAPDPICFAGVKADDEVGAQLSPHFSLQHPTHSSASERLYAP